MEGQQHSTGRITRRPVDPLTRSGRRLRDLHTSGAGGKRARPSQPLAPPDSNQKITKKRKKTMQSRFFVFATACVVALQMSPGLAADGLGEGNQMSSGLFAGRSGAGN